MVQPATPASLIPAGREPRLQASLAVWAFLLVLLVGILGALYLQLARDGPATVGVLVSKTDLPVFHQMRPSDFELRAIAADRTTSKTIRRRDQAIGRYTLSRIHKGAPLSDEQLGPVVRPGVIGRSLIIGIQTTHSATIGDRLERGSHPDLLLTPRVSRRGIEPVTLRDVLILDVVPAPSPARGTTVIVAITRAQEKALAALGEFVPTFILRVR